ncbi:DUF488 domain-containing protein [Schlesneria sp. DSM 10557]|uniref:DUF488 domain-containing protein n=1 Tax=Schlesneria sp. DSM 10557 TaxID=3044399 RepID=UPI00359F4BBE
MIFLKRVYDEPSSQDGTRILVERLWPRGVSKEKGAIDLWLKEIAPTTELRKWFGHDPAKWDEFRQRYWAELRHNQAPLETLRAKSAEGAVTLVYSSHDQEHNSAIALRDFLETHR